MLSNNDHLLASGHLVAEVPLQPPETGLTLYWKNGKVATTDGPYAETKEQLGGIQIFEARDLNHAVQLVSQQPGFKYGLGPIEIRPVADLSEIIKESEQRRRRKDTSHEGGTSRLLKNSAWNRFWEGHDFSRAAKSSDGNECSRVRILPIHSSPSSPAAAGLPSSGRRQQQQQVVKCNDCNNRG
jgi:hypothetical protein